MTNHFLPSRYARSRIGLLSCALAFVVHARVSLADEPPILPQEGRASIRWTEAEDFIGKMVAVSGKIVRVGHAKAIHFLDFSRTDHDAFKVVIFDRIIDQFPGTLEELYEGRIVQVTGTISVYAGNPQIVAASRNQIEVLDELPDISKRRVQGRKRKTTNTFKLATFNIKNLFDADDDPYHADEGTPPKPRDELERVAGVIRELDADILALQEVEERGYLERFLNVLLPDLDYKHVVHFEGNDLRGIDVCLLSRLPIGAVTSFRHLRFRDQENVPRRFNRDLLSVEVLPQSGDAFEVWVVHLKSNHGGKEVAEPIRLGESREIRRLIDQRLSEDPQAQFVVCGDFNDTFDSPTMRTIVGAGDRPLVCFRDQLSDPDAYTYNREPYLSMIDFILCSPAMARRYQSGSYQVRASSLDESGSDHNPVSSRFFFRQSDALGAGTNRPVGESVVVKTALPDAHENNSSRHVDKSTETAVSASSEIKTNDEEQAVFLDVREARSERNVQLVGLVAPVVLIVVGSFTYFRQRSPAVTRIH